MHGLLLPINSESFASMTRSIGQNSMKKNVVSIWWAMCFFFPLSVVWFGEYILAVIQVRPFDFRGEFWPRVGQSVLAALPFVFLAVFSRQRLKTNTEGTWNGVRGAGIGVTAYIVALWGYYYFDSMRESGGANIALGVALLLSPVCSLLIMYACFLLFRRGSSTLKDAGELGANQ